MLPIVHAGIMALTPAVSKTKQEASPGKIAEAAKEFESLILQQLLKSARESPESQSGIFSSGQSNETFSSMAEEHFAQALAAQGGLGLARLVSQGLLRDQARADQQSTPVNAAADSSTTRP